MMKKLDRFQKIKLFLRINSLIWVILAVARLVLFFDKLQDNFIMQMVIFAMLFVNGIGFYILSWGLERWKRIFLKISFLYMLINIALTVTDQAGIVDYLILGLDLLIFYWLIKESFYNND